MADDVIHLKPGDPPPGSFEPGAHGLRVWQGPCEWRTTHGTATVHWLLGRPNRIQGAMTAEGALDIETSSPLDRDTWRRRSPERPGRWILGTIEIRDDGVAFTDKPSTPFEPFAQGDVPDLAADLSADAAFIERVRDVGFAHAAYASLCNTEWRKDPSRRRWSCSWRTAGGLVADLRQLDESYIDFYLQDHVLEGGEPAGPAKRRALYLEVLGHYRRLGWHLVEEAEAKADHEAALAALETHEAAAPGPCPGWAEWYKEREVQSAHDRLVMAARAGKVPKETFDELSENLSYEADAEVSTFAGLLSQAREGDPRKVVVTAETPEHLLEIFGDGSTNADSTET